MSDEAQEILAMLVGLGLCFGLVLAGLGLGIGLSEWLSH